MERTWVYIKWEKGEVQKNLYRRPPCVEKKMNKLSMKSINWLIVSG